MLKNSKKMFIGASTLVYLLGWSTVSKPSVANATPMKGNHQYIAPYQAGMDGQGLLNLWLQLTIPNTNNYQNIGLYSEINNEQHDNGLHLGQLKNKHNNGLHLGQFKDKSNNESQYESQNGQQSFFNIISEAADILDIDEQTIIDKLQNGSTLVEIAKSYDVSKSSLLADLKDRLKDAIDDAVTAGTITETQATEMKSKLTEALTQAIENNFNSLNTSLSAPDDLTATAKSDNEISLDWDSVPDATSYYVYRATSYSGTYTKIATVTTSRYTDDDLAANKTYYYKVKAHNSTDTSDYSSIVHATTDED